MVKIIEGKITNIRSHIDRLSITQKIYHLTLITNKNEEIDFYSMNLESASIKSGGKIIALNLFKFWELICKIFYNGSYVKFFIHSNNILSIEEYIDIIPDNHLATMPDTSFDSTFKLQVFCDSELHQYRHAFDNAISRWSQIVLGGCPKIPNFSPNIDFNITAFTSRIDGLGGISAGAKPINIDANFQDSSASWIFFDIADIQTLSSAEILEDTILHEIGHILGIGTLWHKLGLVRGMGSNNPEFIGINAMEEYARLIGASDPTPVPVENIGQQGVRDCHWRESVFGDELMTSFLDVSQNPISRITIASLMDLGYQVNLEAADPYSRYESKGRVNISNRGKYPFVCTILSH